MPGFDGTGPRGQGPMTGGARGYCVTGWGRDAYGGYGLRRWPRRGARGRGAGWRWDGVDVPVDVPAADFAAIDDLAEQVRVLASRVEALSARLDAKGGDGG